MFIVIDSNWNYVIDTDDMEFYQYTVRPALFVTKIRGNEQGLRLTPPAYTFSATDCLYLMAHGMMQFLSNMAAPMIAAPVNKVISNSSTTNRGD